MTKPFPTKNLRFFLTAPSPCPYLPGRRERKVFTGLDGLDAEATHYLAFVDGKPAGTARMRIVQGAAKMERVAVRAPYRRSGVGRALMEKMIEESKQRPQLKEAKLGAQLQAIPFYESLGFTPYGEEYMDARIPHRHMTRKLAN